MLPPSPLCCSMSKTGSIELMADLMSEPCSSSSSSRHPLPPRPGPPQPVVHTLPGLLTALAANLDRLWSHNALTLHTSWTVQEVIAAEARILESVHYEVGTCSPAVWVHFLAARFSLKAEQLRQRTPPAVRFPLSLTVVPVDVMRSGALLVAAGFARDCTLAPDITPSRLGCSAWFVTCLLWECLLHAGVLWG